MGSLSARLPSPAGLITASASSIRNCKFFSSSFSCASSRRNAPRERVATLMRTFFGVANVDNHFHLAILQQEAMCKLCTKLIDCLNHQVCIVGKTRLKLGAKGGTRTPTVLPARS